MPDQENIQHDSLKHKDMQKIIFKGKTHWMPNLPKPKYTPRGLWFWDKLDKTSWRPQCACGRIFDNLGDYKAHVVYVNSPYYSGERVESYGEK